MIEEFRPVVGFEGVFEVSNLGTVRSLERTLSDGRTWKARTLTPKKTTQYGHQQVRLCHDGHHWRSVHRLVLEAFVGSCPDGMECAHNDGNPENNSLDNLRWATRKENHADKRGHGTLLRGGKANGAKLSEDMVREIRRLARNGTKQRSIANTFAVTESNISQIIKGKTWSWVQ